MNTDSSNEESDLVERYKFTVSYNGTAFYGFQRQGSTRTVQLELENALKKLGWREDSITGAGRTDSGVHAAGQVVSAALEWHHGEEQLRNALNAALPDDLAVLKVEKTRQDFNARYDALTRTYHYQVYFSPVRLPLQDEFSWRIWPKLSLDDLNTISRHFTGIHDFRAFGSPPRKDRSTVREIFTNSWKQQSEDEAYFEIEANAFLYHMVRRIVHPNCRDTSFLRAGKCHGRRNHPRGQRRYRCKTWTGARERSSALVCPLSGTGRGS